MKSVLAVVAVALIYWFVIRPASSKPGEKGPPEVVALTPVGSEAKGPAPAATPGSNILKRPLDRTRAAIDAVGKRNEPGEL